MHDDSKSFRSTLGRGEKELGGRRELTVLELSALERRRSGSRLICVLFGLMGS